MKKLQAIIRREYLERVKTKGFVLSTVLIPLLMSLTIVIPMLTEKSGDRERTMAVIDVDGTWLPGLLAVAAADTNLKIALEPVADDVGDLPARIDEMKRMVSVGEVYGGLVLEEDFQHDPKLSFYVKSVSASIAGGNLRPAINAVLQQARMDEREIDPVDAAYVMERVSWERLTVGDDGTTSKRDEQGVMGMAFILIMMLYMMVLLYGQTTLTGVIEEKTSRVVEVMLSSVSSWHLMLGKILGIGAAGLTQIVIWGLSLYAVSLKGVTVAGISIDASILSPLILVSFLVFFVLGFLIFSSLYAGVGALCNTVQEAQPFSTPIMMFVILPMLMLSMVMRSPDSPLAVGLSLFPLFTPILMFIRVCLQTPPVWQILLSWLLMIGTIYFFSRIAAKLFRVGILMHGAAPSWGTLVKVLKQPD